MSQPPRVVKPSLGVGPALRVVEEEEQLEQAVDRALKREESEGEREQRSCILNPLLLSL